MYIFSLCHTGFGINSNILETNILNLAVVIYLLIPLKDTYVEVLEKRTARIVAAMKDAQRKYEQFQAALKLAKFKYVAAKHKSYRIRARKRIFLKKLGAFNFEFYNGENGRTLRTRYNKSILVKKQVLDALREELNALIVSDVTENIKETLTDPEERRLVFKGCLSRFIFGQKRKRKFRLMRITRRMFANPYYI
jgi:F-type H+-transporting ATPase subunit b